MIIVTGHVHGTTETIDELLAMSLEHVHRSRLEPGCLSHSVHRDAEDPRHLFFFEEWADAEAIQAHFAVPESRAFAAALTELAAVRPTLTIYEARTAKL